MKKNDFTVPHEKITPDLFGWIVISYQEIKEPKTTFSYNAENQLKEITSFEQIIYRADVKNIIDKSITTYDFPSNFPIKEGDFIFAIFHNHQDQITIERYYNYRTEKMSTEYDGLFNEQTLHKLNILESICKRWYVPFVGLIQFFCIFFKSIEYSNAYRYYQKLYDRIYFALSYEFIPIALSGFILFQYKNIYLCILLYFLIVVLFGHLIVRKHLIPLVKKNITDFKDENKVFDEFAVSKINELINNPEILAKASEIISKNVFPPRNEPPPADNNEDKHEDMSKQKENTRSRMKRAVSRNGFRNALARPNTSINTASDLLKKLVTEEKLKEVKGFLDEKCLDKKGNFLLVYYKRRLANLMYNLYIKEDVHMRNRREWLLDFKSEKEIVDALTKEESIYYLKK